MNKAEEQYFYWLGKVRAQMLTMEYGRSERLSINFPAAIKSLCRSEVHILKNSTRFDDKGKLDYLTTIIHAIDGNVITDWPSFVTYMTGETYER